jgi:hypothetical protein
MTVSGFDPAGERHFYIRRHAGAPGTTLAKRQLQSARGLATLKDSAAAEHVAIADPVGARVVLWDARTKFKTSYTTAGLFATGLASHPTTTNRIFALDRNANVIRLLQYASNALTQVASYPLGTTVGKSDSAEIGLAAAASGTDVLLAVTDAASKRVLEYKLTSGGTFTAVATYTQGLPPVFSSATLERPLDVAYSTVAGARRLYVTDKLARVMRLY